MAGPRRQALIRHSVLLIKASTVYSITFNAQLRYYMPDPFVQPGNPDSATLVSLSGYTPSSGTPVVTPITLTQNDL